MKTNAQKYHIHLAKYFPTKPLFFDGELQKKPYVRKCVEQPWQQTKAELWDEVTETLCNLDFIQARSCSKQTYNLIKDYHFAMNGLPEYRTEKEKERHQQERLEKYTRDLISYAKGEIEELEVPKSIKPLTQAQIDSKIEHIKSNPSRVNKLNAFINFLGHEADNLHKYANEFSHFTTQQAWNFSCEGPVAKSAEIISPEVFKSLLLRSQSTRPPWNPLPQNIKTLIRHTDTVHTVDITPDGQMAISGSYDGTYILWDLKTGDLIRTMKGDFLTFPAVSITPDGQMAITNFKNTCILWNLGTGEKIKTLIGHSEGIRAVAITPDGQLAISGSNDKTCILWNLNSGTPIHILNEHTNSVNAVAITPDGQFAVSGSWDNTCIFWNLKTGKSIQFLKGHTNWIEGVSMTPDAQKAISCSRDNTCILWDLKTGKAIYILEGHSSPVMSVSMTSDGQMAISGSQDNTCILWDLKTGESKHSLIGHTSSIEAVSITSNGNRAFSGSMDKTCILWNLKKGNPIRIQKKHTKEIISLAITPDGQTAISGSQDCTCIIWDIKTGEPIQELKGHTKWVQDVSITSDGQRAISSSDDYTCILWDVIKGNPLLTLHKGGASKLDKVSFTPDGQNAISTSPNKVILWDLKTGEPIQIISGLKNQIWHLHITPDGQWAILNCSRYRRIWWNLESGETKHVLWGQANSIWGVTIGADTEKMYSGSWDKTIILWDLKSGKRVGAFLSNSIINSTEYHENGILLGNSSGEITVLNIDKNLLRPGVYITSICQLYDFELNKYQQPSSDCPICYYRFIPPNSVLVAIEEIREKADLTTIDSPFLKLPNKAWEQHNLFDECPNCKARLKFNPFIEKIIDPALK